MTSESSHPLVLDPDAMAKRLMQRAHLRDGLPEIAIGLTFLLVGCLNYAQVVLPRQSIGFKAAILALAILIPLWIFGTPWVLKWVRRRFLMEKLGYVQPKPIGRKQIGIGILFGVVVTAALFGAATRSSVPELWVLAGTGVLGGALSALCGRVPRFVIGGVLMAATGIAMGLSGASLETGFAVLFGSQGLLALISGGVVFLRFHRQPMETGD